MEPLDLFVFMFVIFGHRISISEAGIPDSIRNIIDPSSNHPYDRQNEMKQFLSPFRDNQHGLVADYDPNTNSRLPFGHLIHSRTPFDDPNNSRWPVGDPRRMLGHIDWWPDETTESPQLNFHKDLPKPKPSTNCTPDYDQIIADRFPQAAKILEGLKKLKDYTGPQEQQGPAETPPPPKKKTKARGKPAIHSSKTTRPRPVMPKGKGNKTSTKIAEVDIMDGKLIMKNLRKRKIYRQTQPVRTKNERNTSNKSVYYIDK